MAARTCLGVQHRVVNSPLKKTSADLVVYFATRITVWTAELSGTKNKPALNGEQNKSITEMNQS